MEVIVYEKKKIVLPLYSEVGLHGICEVDVASLPLH